MPLPSLLASHIRTGRLTHGYLLIGSRDKARAVVLEVAKNVIADFDENGASAHADFYELSDVLLGIDAAKDIIKKANLRSLHGGGKVFLLDADDITREAANAFLKLMEETSSDNYFFIRASSPDIILPTLRSRLVAVWLAKDDEASLAGYFGEFSKKPFLDQMRHSQKIAEDKDVKSGNLLLDACEVYYENMFRNCKTDKDWNEIARKLDGVSYVRELLASSAAYAKPALEYLVINNL
ncbi:MAG: hypothetical protein HZC14_03380 [Candidatus Niyogibacteria bacterium]|nr:hypothetical protein [Candidatus Niyogibacteria bacterium]